MKRTTLTAFALASIATLSACGDSDSPPTAAAASTTAKAAVSATVAPTETPTTVVTASASASPASVVEGRATVTANADGTRTVTSAWGTATVPAKPQRIVSVLGYVDLESMLALGVTPLAAGTQGGTIASGFAPHLKERIASVKPLPWADGAPTEAIAALRPDLIFAPDEESAKLLQKIAPTVPAGAADAAKWKQDFTYIAAVLGVDADAQRLLGEYESHVADVRDRLKPVVDGRTVASPQVAHDHTQVYVDRSSSFSSAVLTELGFTLAPLIAKPAEENISISFERLPEIDADILFWQVRQRDEDGSRDVEGLATVKRNPLWPSIPAVKAAAVFEVDNRPWYFPTILAARRIVDDVDRALLH